MAILSPTMRLAIEVNAERGHFRERYEGFNDCLVYSGELCDCGNAEAVVALREIRSQQIIVESKSEELVKT